VAGLHKIAIAPRWA